MKTKLEETIVVKSEKPVRTIFGLKGKSPLNLVSATHRSQGVTRQKTLKEAERMPYSFRQDAVIGIFRMAIRNGLQLPESKRPNEAMKTNDPEFCPYHRVVSHKIENCWVFKDWVEQNLKTGEITLPPYVLQSPALHGQKHERKNSESTISKGKRKCVQGLPLTEYPVGRKKPAIPITGIKMKPYSFRKDNMTDILCMTIYNGLQLPKSKRPLETNKFDHPNFCLYHRIIGHKVEDCWVFKGWIEENLKTGRIVLPSYSLQNPAPHECGDTRNKQCNTTTKIILKEFEGEQIEALDNTTNVEIDETDSEEDELESIFEKKTPCMVCSKVDNCYKQFTCNECMETCHPSCCAAMEEEISEYELDPRYNFWRCEECDIIYSAIEAKLYKRA